MDKDTIEATTAAARECEDCGEMMEPSQRRRRCSHCGMLVCGWCDNHVHALSREAAKRAAAAQPPAT